MGESATETAQLVRSCAEIGLPLTPAQSVQLLALLDALEKWNRAYNLTAIAGRAAWLTHHVLDSLAVHGAVRGPRVADVGTGAGFPGLPLAIVQPAFQFTLIDANSKKIRFVEHAVHTLGLRNVAAQHARVETLHAAPPYDTVLARAFAPLPRLLAAV
ncbi:MAG: 16S rRNA (guanine(527)-N(7))-methyltransferase RsmG, partial [Steroidobacteraceae bacterium]|nr:16S rRNA (guanine(527)-N(7))-methyltransferase RsmG [Steroidobacteraceae bacterium]